MSTATSVPSTVGLEGDDAIHTLRSVGRRKLLADSFQRFRAADGFSHSRALAFQIALTMVPALIAVIGIATLLGQGGFTDVVQESLDTIAPGAAQDILTEALREGEQRGGRAVLIGVIATLVAGTTAFGQLERGANRIYGVERDRPPLQKYGVALTLCCTAGLAALGAFVVLVAGRAIRRSAGWGGSAETIWDIARWPLGVVLFVVALALLFEVTPRRRQPEASWLVSGSIVSAVIWFSCTGMLSLFLDTSRDFGQTYGSLAGTIALLLWALFSAVAILFGLSVAAQLEAVRAGVSSPREEREENRAS